MSKLADAIRRASRRESPPLGFGAAAGTRPSPTLLCLVRLPPAQAGKAAEAAARGATAVILEEADPARLGEGRAPEGVTWGARPARAERSSVAALRQAGADFVVLDGQAAAEAILEEGIGFVLALSGRPSDGELRALEGLPLDALLVPPLEGAYTLERLLELRRLSLLSRTPLIIPAAADAPASHLQALREAGVCGLVIEAGALDRLPDLRQRIESLPPRGRRREERLEAVLPTRAAAPAPVEDEEEEEGLAGGRGREDNVTLT